MPLDFALYLPEEWLQEECRREVGIPQDVTFHSKWELALTLIDRTLEI
jgi:SRSO17 transposase